VKELQSGLTLIELLITIAIASILLAIAAPSFTSMLARQRIEGVTQELAADLGYASSETVSRNSTVVLATDASGISYSLTAGATSLKSLTLGSGLAITPNITISFQPMRGDSNTASITVSHNNSSTTLRVSTNDAGRVQVCSPNGTFSGYTAC
jgi:type IV fimbrial biogenesis protein FimT